MENFGSLANANANDLHHQNPNKPNMENKPIKVKYISTPMMVKANNASEFRAIVQKLTGQHSPDHASYDARDRRALLSGNVCDPAGREPGEVCDWGGEIMEASFSGFQASYIDAWPST